MASTLESPPPAGVFNAARWLSEWTEHGGIFILAGDHLHLRRTSPLPLWATFCLDLLRDEMMRSGGGPAIAQHLLRQREGDIAR